MQEMLSEIFTTNKEYGVNQKLTKSRIPTYILMIDRETERPVSPYLKDVYTYATEWTNGFFGMDLVDPNTLADVYSDPWVSESIRLTAENYLPLPPSLPSDWQKTAVFAKERDGLGLVFLWWHKTDEDEPAIVSIEGGSIDVFYDIREMLKFLSHGDFPERGQDLYRKLETERGTLSS